MSSGVLKFYNTSEKTDVKVIDSNSRMDIRLQELKSVVPVIEETYPEDGGEFVEGIEGFESLDPEQIEALTSDNPGTGNVIKAFDAEAEIQAAQAKADEIVATAEQLAMEFKENSRREADIECHRIKADAKQQGYEEGLAQAEAEYSERMNMVDMRARQLEQQFEELFAELEPRFIETITSVYEHIFNVELSEYQSILTQLVTDTMRKSDNSRNFIIHVSSADYPSMTTEQRELLELAASGAKVDIVEDIGLSRNQCMLETDNGVLDCGLDTQLRELRRKLKLLSYNADPETV